MLANAERAALVCSGAMQGRDHTYALVDERAPTARRLERDEAVAKLVLRYFTGHGPATERDPVYWATRMLTDVRSGLAEVASELDHVEHDGRSYWFAEPRSAPTTSTSRSACSASSATTSSPRSRRAADRYGRFLGLDATVATTRRPAHG